MAVKQFHGKFRLSTRDDAPIIGPWEFQHYEAKDRNFAKLRAAYDAAIEAGTQFQQKAATLRKNDSLSEKGIKDQLRRYATEEGLPLVAKNKLQATATIRRDIAARAAKMVPVEIDKTDIVAEMQRREIREAFRQMKPEQQIRILEANKHPEVVNAVLAAPNFLTGVPESVRKMTEERALEAKYGDERKLLSELEAAAQLVERAHDAARDELRDTSGINEFEFDKLAQPIEQAAVEEFKKVLDKTPINGSPVKDVEALMADINLLPYEERGKLIDGAIARQSAHLSERMKPYQSPIRMPGE